MPCEMKDLFTEGTYIRDTTGQRVMLVAPPEARNMIKGAGEANWHSAVAFVADDPEDEDDNIYFRTTEDFCNKYSFIGLEQE